MLKLSSANTFNLVMSKILLSGKELTLHSQDLTNQEMKLFKTNVEKMLVTSIFFLSKPGPTLALNFTITAFNKPGKEAF